MCVLGEDIDSLLRGFKSGCKVEKAEFGCRGQPTRWVLDSCCWFELCLDFM